MVLRLLAACCAAAVLLTAQLAYSAGCPAHYVSGRAPELSHPSLAQATTELCYAEFGILHSGLTRTPLWSAEHLTAANLMAARTLSRQNSFHAEAGLPVNQRAELVDYARSGFDRGHMAPNGDMPDRFSQGQSFTLANMVPQNGNNNRHIWAAIEGAVRKMALREGELYVITGPAFIGGKVQKIGNVLVPSHLYKVVYSPKQSAGAAYFIENTSTDAYQVLSIAQLETRIGINLLPSLSARQKELMLGLPKIGVKQRP